MVVRMSPIARVASFAVILGVVFGVAFALGSAVDPADTEAGSAHGDRAHSGAAGHVDHVADEAAAGLAVAEGGYALRLSPTRMQPGEAGELSFRIEDAEGAAVRRFDELHEREMHLIVVRRDGTGFQHLHPGLGADGTWRVGLTLPAAGVYRVFADFSVAGEQRTLATDLFAPGRFRPRPFPASAAVDRIGLYEVRLRSGAPVAATPSELRFAISERGRPAEPERYLGARGHLVALREGDLAFLHVHPEAGSAPSVVAYSAGFPTAGRYRLFLQFKHGGRVWTAPFTVTVAR